MKKYTVQCGYASYCENTVTVEAETLDKALELAIEKANDDDLNWETIDYCGDTFIDAVAEGDDVDPRSSCKSKIPVPTRFTEDGETPVVEIELENSFFLKAAVTRGKVDIIYKESFLSGQKS